MTKSGDCSGASCDERTDILVVAGQAVVVAEDYSAIALRH